MDLTTLGGILIGFVMVIGAISIGPDPGGFIDIPSLLIVFGGTFAAVLVSFPMEEVLQAFKAGIKAFTTKRKSPSEVVDVMVQIAVISRREGLLALQNTKTDNPILRKAILLIADNADPELIRTTVGIEIASLKKRHNIGISVFQRLGDIAPAFGMIGTLIGLVQMLSVLDDPTKIGPSMAVALITTFYGAMLANLIFIPLAVKLKSRSAQEELRLKIIFEGANSILENNNPNLVYEKLSSFLPPNERTGNG